jgi:argininosuccinate synthase
MKRIVLAHSGGRQTTAAIARLADHLGPGAGIGPEIIAVIVDTGRRTDLVEQREHALALGAVRCHVVDAREELTRDYLLPAMQAQAFVAARAPLAPAIARAAVARKVADVAKMESADAIAFGRGRIDDRASLDVLVRAIDPAIALVDVAGVLPAEPDRAGGDLRVKVAVNVWGRVLSFDLRGGWDEPGDDVYMLTRAPQDCPDQPAYVEIEFDGGRPVRVNGIEMPILEMIESLDTIGGAHGVGRTDVVAVRGDGTGIRHLGEAPAATILQRAHAELQALAQPSDVSRIVGDAAGIYADLVEAGHWWSQTRSALDGFAAVLQSRVAGSIRLMLFQGECRVVGRGLRADAGPGASTTPAAPDRSGTAVSTSS